MKTTIIILSLFFIAQFSVGQHFKKNTLAFQINNENKNLKNWLITNDSNFGQTTSIKEKTKLRLDLKTGMIYFLKSYEVDFGEYLSEKMKEKSIIDQELEIRIHGKTDNSTRNNK